MLRTVETMLGLKLEAEDGEIGEISDLYFDDQTWRVRHFAAETGKWFQDKRVLINPRRIAGLKPEQGSIEADVTMAEVEVCPPAECEMPISERLDILYYPYSFWPPSYQIDEIPPEADVHLRSMKEVEGYTLAATDGDIGHIDGFVVDDGDWAIRYLEVDTRSLLPGKHVLMSPEWIEGIDWHLRQVRVNLPREAIKRSPEYDPDEPVSRAYEIKLCRFYNREGYWEKSCGDDSLPTDSIE